MKTKRKGVCAPHEEEAMDDADTDRETDEDDEEELAGEEDGDRLDFSPTPDDAPGNQPLKSRGARKAGRKQAAVVRPQASSALNAMRQRMLLGVVADGYRMYGSGFIRRLDF